MGTHSYGETLQRLAMPEIPDLPGLRAYEDTDAAEIFDFRVFRDAASLRLLEAMMHFFIRAIDEYRLSSKVLKEAAQLYARLERAEQLPLLKKEQAPCLLGVIDVSDRRVVGLFNDGRDHLELCVNLLRRAIAFGRRYRKAAGRPSLPRKVERLGVLSKTVADRIMKVRHAIEHADEMLIKGEVDTVWTCVEDQAISYAGQRLYYDEIIGWFREFDSLVSFIFQPFADMHADEDAEFNEWLRERGDDAPKDD